MSARTTHRVLIAHHYTSMSPSGLVNFSKAVRGLIMASSDVTDPAADVTEWNTHNINLDATIKLRITDTSPTLTLLEHDQFTIVVDDLNAIADQVEGIGNHLGKGDAAVAKAFIESFGFHIRKDAERKGRTFEVVEAGHGHVTIRTKASNHSRVSYLWQYAIKPVEGVDPDWSDSVITVESSVTIKGLQNDTRYVFRSAIILPRGRTPVVQAGHHEPDWGDAISALIS